MFNKRTNNNYRTHQTYLERVNNYINHMHNKDDENILEDDQQFDSQPQQPQQQQQPSNTFVKGQFSHNGSSSSNPNVSSRRFQPSFKPSSALQQQQQQGGQGFNKFNGAASSNKLNATEIYQDENQVDNNTMIEQPVQQQQPEKPRRVTANDLRNKRTNIMNHSYSSYHTGNKKNASYSVKFAISSGGYQTDSL
jgi:hypothetical protein